MRFLWAFRYNPIARGSSDISHAIAGGNCVGSELPKVIRCAQPGGRNFGTKLRGLPPST
ncbi:MAG: hypothetical protein LBK44_03655 [Spirochaetales bacterium]|nr:hypothetical protein [Spirochaetales bacterium]